MQLEGGNLSVSVIWREKRFVVEMSQSATLNEFGEELRKLTGVNEDTMRLLMPKSFTGGSKLFYPFADEHKKISLQEVSVKEGKYIRMMGATKDEVDDIIKNEKANLRIAGFEDEDRRLRQRMSGRPQYSLKLPQGTYIFCEFRTLDLPIVKLNPPPSEALKRMHRLAADPGIVAVMNKHRWRVGIMSEMAPEGYVGISSVCILGYNKNQGEEISLRLRTDDLKGFRKYEVIKKTLLHELAHMVHSEHDANFHALNSQLNKEASSLDWTKSRSHTLSGSALSAYNEDEFDEEDYGSTSQKLGGDTSGLLMSARSASIAAAFNRLASGVVSEEKDTDASSSAMDENRGSNAKIIHIPRLDSDNEAQSQAGVLMSKIIGDEFADLEKLETANSLKELELVDGSYQLNNIRGLEDSINGCCLSNGHMNMHMDSEPDPDDSLILAAAPELQSVYLNNTTRTSMDEPKLDDQLLESHVSLSATSDEIAADQERSRHTEPIPCGIPETLASNNQTEISLSVPMDIYEPDPDDEEMKRIQDPVMIFCSRLQTAVQSLRSEVKTGNFDTVLKTLAKIISNVIEHPDEIKFKRLRKANPAFARNVENYKAALEILSMVGFQEEIVSSETFLVLKRNDPGLLWLAKSSLDAYTF